MKLDIGCGKNKKEGFIGVDAIAFDGVDWLCLLNHAPWRFVKNIGSVDVPLEWERAAIEGGSMYRGEGWPRDGMRFALPDQSVDEVHCSHFIEHLTGVERCHFVNELHRVLKPKAQATLIVPSWTSNRAYGDPTHQWPPVSEMWFYYLGKDWRATQAPHTDKSNWAQGFDCDFDATWGYGMHPQLLTRNDEFRQFALQWYREAAQDIHVTLTKR